MVIGKQCHTMHTVVPISATQTINRSLRFAQNRSLLGSNDRNMIPGYQTNTSELGSPLEQELDHYPCGMEETAPRTSDVNWSTAEASSEDQIVMHFTITGDIKAPAEGDVLARYFAIAKSIRAQILRFHAKQDVAQFYNFPPVLVARNVNVDVLEELPTLVIDMHVKSAVRDGSLLIISLSDCDAHGSGICCMGAQVGDWSQNYFVTKIDTTLKYAHNSGRSPDIVVEVKAVDRSPSGRRRRLIVMELEVSNRSILDMQRDFVEYFQDESVFCVIAIKIFIGTTDGIIGTRAVAMQWTRPVEGGGPVVEAVGDIGFLPITEQAKALFATDLHGGALPPVPCEQWAANRHVPVLFDHPMLPTGLRTEDFATAALRHVHSLCGDGWQTLYGTVHPTFRIDGARACSYIHNLPPGVLPVGDLWLNLAEVFYVAVSSGDVPPPPVQAKPLQQQEQKQQQVDTQEP